MKSNRTRLILIGLFVIGGAAMTGWLVIVFGEAPKSFVGGAYTLPIKFAGVAMTTKGTEVVFTGKRIGQVKSVDFADPNDVTSGIVVIAEIEKRYRLPATVRAVESSTSLVMGRAIIQLIVPPASATEPVGDLLPVDRDLLAEGRFVMGGVLGPLDSVLPSSMVPTIENTIREVGKLAESLRSVSFELEDLIKRRPLSEVSGPDATQVPNLSTVVQRLDAGVNTINKLLEDPKNQENVRVTLENLRNASDQANKAIGDFRQVAVDAQGIAADARNAVGELRGYGRNLDSQVGDISKRAVVVLDEAGRAMGSADALMRRAIDGKGSLGLFLNDNRLYESMVLTVARLDGTFKQMQDLLDQWKRGQLKFKVF